MRVASWTQTSPSAAMFASWLIPVGIDFSISSSS
jgi:hypothetical protein